MKQNVYSVRDSVAGVYCKPFTTPNDGLARRDFDAASRDPHSALSQHPDDFTLFCIGSFDEETGLLEAIPPRFVTRTLSNQE